MDFQDYDCIDFSMHHCHIYIYKVLLVPYMAAIYIRIKISYTAIVNKIASYRFISVAYIE